MGSESLDGHCTGRTRHTAQAQSGARDWGVIPPTIHTQVFGPLFSGVRSLVVFLFCSFNCFLSFVLVHSSICSFCDFFMFLFVGHFLFSVNIVWIVSFFVFLNVFFIIYFLNKSVCHFLHFS